MSRQPALAWRAWPSLVLVLLCLACGRRTGAAGALPRLHVAVASNMQTVLGEVVADFQREHPCEVVLSSASSGKLCAQIEHGAPYQLFLSADSAAPLRLEERGLAVPGTRRVFAVGRLALYLPAPPAGEAGLALLRAPSVRRIAIAAPESAPYGRAAREALQASGLWQELEPKLVYGESVAQAFAFVTSGAADAGLVALSQLHEAGLAPTWIVPDGLHAPLEQVALLVGGEASAEARLLLDHLASPAARERLRAAGYLLPP